MSVRNKKNSLIVLNFAQSPYIQIQLDFLLHFQLNFQWHRVRRLQRISNHLINSTRFYNLY